MTKPIITVRRGQTDDIAAVVAFNVALALETEAEILDPFVLERGVERALADPDHLCYWIAEIEDAVIGQAAVSREWSDWRNGWIWWLQSVYTAPEQRRRGVLRTLFEAIHNEAIAAGNVVGLRLYVEADNRRAHQAYSAIGLSPSRYHVYETFWSPLNDKPRSDPSRSAENNPAVE